MNIIFVSLLDCLYTLRMCQIKNKINEKFKQNSKLIADQLHNSRCHRQSYRIAFQMFRAPAPLCVTLSQQDATREPRRAPLAPPVE